MLMRGNRGACGEIGNFAHCGQIATFLGSTRARFGLARGWWGTMMFVIFCWGALLWRWRQLRVRITLGGIGAGAGGSFTRDAAHALQQTRHVIIDGVIVFGI